MRRRRTTCFLSCVFLFASLIISIRDSLLLLLLFFFLFFPSFSILLFNVLYTILMIIIFFIAGVPFILLKHSSGFLHLFFVFVPVSVVVREGRKSMHEQELARVYIYIYISLFASLLC